MDSTVNKRPPPPPIQHHSRHNTNSSISTTSIHHSSSLLLSIPSATNTIERQLHSLVHNNNDINHHQPENEQVLQKTFEELDVDPTDQQSQHSAHTASSVHSIPHSLRDFSAFTFPFTERPTVSSHHTKSGHYYYIPTPTAIRNYLDYPLDLADLQLPYPFRVKEPVSERLERIETQHGSSQRRSKQPMTASRHAKRHSLALGQVDQLRKKSDKVRESASTSRVDHDIMSWMPDQRTIWQDWMSIDDVSSHHSQELSFTDEQQLHPLDSIHKKGSH
ncbi:MAG: hypothetical protein EXX96DRAFT_582932 [Benjaminiella poitrasii]|nr:MAG: hypothetical protein EXX96DRAFT_582932 [Benjaminiella poitrasii]